jgi:transposase
MLLQTILNRLHKHKSFVYGTARWGTHAEAPALEVPIAPRANGRPVCSGCGQAGPGYDRLPERRYQFVPLWSVAVFLLYAPRRVACPRCGVKVERVPWAEGKSRLATIYMWFLAAWAKRLSWQETATVFGTSWSSVYRAVTLAVLWGIAPYAPTLRGATNGGLPRFEEIRLVRILQQLERPRLPLALRPPAAPLDPPLQPLQYGHQHR